MSDKAKKLVRLYECGVLSLDELRACLERDCPEEAAKVLAEYE